MSSFPLNISRVPNLLTSRTALTNITRTNVALFGVQNQLATGRSVLRPSDDPVRASAILTLDSRLERADQRLRNLDHANTSLNVLDSALAEVSDLILEAKSISSQQSNVGSSAAERKSQALVVQSLLDGLFETVNRESISGHLFGGSAPGKRPVEAFLSGYQYVGQGNGLVTDLGLGSSVPVTLGRGNGIVPNVAKIKGLASFSLELTPDTRLADLRGARGLGVSPSVIELSFNGMPSAQFDLSNADTVQDVVDTLNQAIGTYEQANNVTILGAGGVSISGGSITIDVVPDAGGGPNPALRFYDLTGGAAAEDLGLSASGSTVEFSATENAGRDLDPMLTWRTPASMVDGMALGQLKIENGGKTSVVDLTGAQTFGEIKAAIEGAGLGVTVELNAAADGIDIVNNLSAGRDGALSITEIGVGDTTADRLGIRSFAALTRTSDLNFGKGVQVVSGRTDPTTGLIDPALNQDFRITLGNGRSFSVDLRPSDIATVGDIIARINAEAVSQSIAVPSDFEATISATSNGIEFTQDTTYAQPIAMAKLNDSPAFAQLGLGNGTHTNGGATFTSSNTSKVRVASVFSDLLDLKSALNANDTFGILFAAEQLEGSVDNVSQTRALVGGFTNRVTKATSTQEDQALIDESVRSDMRDLDFAQAAVNLNLLQVQLAASMQTTAMMSSRTLLDFLG
jgi:flagellin-like hook-associated protein FlgL